MLNKLDATGPSLNPASSPLEAAAPLFLLDCSRVILCGGVPSAKRSVTASVEGVTSSQRSVTAFRQDVPP